ncbi:MAG: AI-2E family transporter [Janthinobacterium lividum]
MTLPVSPTESDLEWQRRRALATERIARLLAWAFGVVLVVAICWGMADIVLLIFAAALLACLLRGGAEFLSKKIGGPVGLWLAAIMLVIVALLGFGIFVRGPIIAGQLHDIWGQLKEQATSVWQRYGSADWLQPVLGRAKDYFQDGTQKIAGMAAGVGSSTLGGLGSLVVMVVTAIFFAVDPALYVQGTASLMPKEWRPHAVETMGCMAHVLRWWFIGQFLDMCAVGILTAIGLYAIGVKLAFTLALIAALFNFVPYIGALAGAVPAVLIALGQGPQTALYTAILFLVVQTLEGNLIAPLVQKRTVELAPVLTILSQTVLGTLFGPLGLILATPMTAAGVELVKKVWVDEVLDDQG